MSTLNLVFKMRKIEEKTEVGGTSIRTHKPALTTSNCYGMLNVSSMNYNVPKLQDLKICSVEETLTRFASGIMKSLRSPFFSFILKL